MRTAPNRIGIKISQPQSPLCHHQLFIEVIILILNQRFTQNGVQYSEAIQGMFKCGVESVFKPSCILRAPLLPWDTTVMKAWFQECTDVGKKDETVLIKNNGEYYMYS